jgi:hypothetical protein
VVLIRSPSWTRGSRCFCGIDLPDGLRQDQKLDEVLVTPSTKGILRGIPGVPEQVSLSASASASASASTPPPPPPPPLPRILRGSPGVPEQDDVNVSRADISANYTAFGFA